MARLHVLRVFTDERGRHGSPLGVFLDGAEVAESERQGVAHELGYSETVFVDDRARGELRIFTPGIEFPFAGHPLVGAAWLLARGGSPVKTLRPPAGEVPVRYDGPLTWIAGRAEWSPGFEYLELRSPADVDGLDGPPGARSAYYCWAWEDRAAGTVRARAFLPGAGVEEDEASGSAALALCARLGRELEIRQGGGSLLLTHPLAVGVAAEVGGRATLDEVRELQL